MSSGTNTERITQNNGIITDNNTAIDNFKTTINNLPTRAVTQTKSVTITENGTTTVQPDTGYDGLSGVEVTTNVSGDYNTLVDPSIASQDQSIMYYITKISANVSFGSRTTILNMFANTRIDEIPLWNTSNITNMQGAFQDCTQLTKVANIDTSNVTTMAVMFRRDTALTTVPILDTRNVANAA